jgi:hypothetical protein
MLGGTSVTERAREHAREMLQSSLGKSPGRRPSASRNGAGSSRARNGRAG